MEQGQLSVDAERLKRMLTESANIGTDPERGPGRFRLALSEQDRKGRAWVTQQMLDAGLDVWLDEALNIHGCLVPKTYTAEQIQALEQGVPGRRKPTATTQMVVTGSHHDTVIGGGSLDGALGVIAGIEVLRVLKILDTQGEIKLKYPLEVVNFTDEEGRFGGMLGSMCIAGKMSKDYLLAMTSADSGQRVMDLLRDQNDHLAGCLNDYEAAERVLRAIYPPMAMRAYVELHIEQGPILDTAGESLAVVTGICGLRKWEITYTGQGNHAGTTPMTLRRNAFEGCCAIQMGIPALLSQHGSDLTVCTIGSVHISPNCPNVVPAKCVFTIEMRDESTDVLDSMTAAVFEELRIVAASHGLKFNSRTMSDMVPVRAHPSIIECFRKNCVKALDGGNFIGCPLPRLIPSGAAHDAQQMATLGPMGMLFVPSVDGISHDPKEYTEFNDILKGANVLLNTMCDLASSSEDFIACGNDKAVQSRNISTVEDHCEEGTSTTALVCVDLQEMPPTTNRDGVDFSDDDVATFKAKQPTLLNAVSNAQKAARRHANMEVIHCRIMSMTQNGRDRSALHKRMKIHVAPSTNHLHKGQGLWMAGVEPKSDELVFNKTGSNAFLTTNIDYVLRNIGIKNLVFCGVLTDECVMGTVNAACDLGYKCTVLTDACMAATTERHNAALATMSRFATRMCTVKEWVNRVQSDRLHSD